MTLEQAQEIFWRLATSGPEKQKTDAEKVFVDFPPLGPVERLRIYANMFIWRQIHVLRADFPKLVGVLGDSTFYQLAESYLAHHPSTHPSVSKLGNRLSEFLEQHPSLPRPDLADLARLEWARTELVEEVDAASISPDFLQGASAQSMSQLRFKTVPALRLLTLKHDVLNLWLEIDLGKGPPPPMDGPISVAVWRKNFEIFHVALDGDEARALSMAMAGQPLQNVCECFTGRNDAIQAALNAVGSWLVEGWIAAP